jgi:hypothetical protein
MLDNGSSRFHDVATTKCDRLDHRGLRQVHCHGTIAPDGSKRAWVKHSGSGGTATVTGTHGRDRVLAQTAAPGRGAGTHPVDRELDAAKASSYCRTSSSTLNLNAGWRTTPESSCKAPRDYWWGIVIVGGGLAASRTAEQRRAEYAGPITIVGDEDHLPYDRPPLRRRCCAPETDGSR